MAATTRTLARALRTSTRPALAAAPRAAFRQGGQRFNSTGPSSGSKINWLWASVGAALVGGGAGYLLTPEETWTKLKKDGSTATVKDYQVVYNAIAKRLEEDDEYDDGSYAPVLLRLAWHASGTYDKETGTGGSNGATMRFNPESGHGANAGLNAARDFLEPIKKEFPWISYSDLWILGGVCAIQEMQGPIVPFRPGRSDRDMSACTPDGRLPDAAQGQDHIRKIFYRMGFNDREIVALIGAHAVGRCHKTRSGYDGPWTFSPTVFTNDFFKLLLDEKWQWKKWDGPKQYEDKKTKSLMMLPGDMAIVEDKKFKEWVVKYAADNDLFFSDFSAAVSKLFELGVPFPQGSEDKKMTFTPTNA